MDKKLPYYKELPECMIVNRDGLTYTAELNFVIKKDKIKNVKKYLDFRNKLDKLGHYFVDTDTGNRKKNKHKVIYVWTSIDEHYSYNDRVDYLKLIFEDYTYKL